jgi:uncharacterized protein (DUF1697 family)
MEEAATFRASGNVIFTTGDGERVGELGPRIEAGLAEAFGYDVPTYVRTAAQMQAMATYEPFATELVAASKGKLQVAMLLEKPTSQAKKKVLAMSTDEDRLAIRDSEMYWLPSGGLLESTLDQKAIAGILGATTVRTKGTVDLIAAKYFAD